MYIYIHRRLNPIIINRLYIIWENTASPFCRLFLSSIMQQREGLEVLMKCPRCSIHLSLIEVAPGQKSRKGGLILNQVVSGAVLTVCVWRSRISLSYLKQQLSACVCLSLYMSHSNTRSSCSVWFCASCSSDSFGSFSGCTELNQYVFLLLVYFGSKCSFCCWLGHHISQTCCSVSESVYWCVRLILYVFFDLSFIYVF